MQIHEIFESKVTRDIPPVVYFHEQSPQKLSDEVSEYIITGGYPARHPQHRPNGIHESYVALLKEICKELDKSGGPDLPNVWISGFYGSGKSSFAKILGMALDGVALPDGKSMAEAWLLRNTSPNRQQLVDAWNELKRRIDSIAVVFDVGGAAKDNEQVHSAVLRHVQQRLGYCSTSANVADFELKLERDGQWRDFLTVAESTLRKPWPQVKDTLMADTHFSLVMSKMFPEHFPDPTKWFQSRAGTHRRNESPSDAVKAIGDMLKIRRPGATLFVVIDEVSQYVQAGAERTVGSGTDRADRLRAFASELGSGLKGQVWMIALGQQKLDQEAGATFLDWAKARFPSQLRVHLSPANIQDVVHRRLLKKNAAGEDFLRKEFTTHQAALQVYAYGCEEITSTEFIEFYPLVPKQIDLMLRITSALRTRSGRAQGDDQAIRGLLQMLGELFRAQNLAEEPVGTLVTVDKIYDVQKSALDSDVDQSMSRILHQCSGDDEFYSRVAKAVAMLELIQETEPTTPKLVAQCLYDRMDRGNQEGKIKEALEDLKRRGLLGYSEKEGYKIQSSAGEEWERELTDVPVAREQISEMIKDGLEGLLTEVERQKLEGRPFPWAAVFSDGQKMDDVRLRSPQDPAVLRVDFRYLRRDQRNESEWVRKSSESQFENRLIWVCGETDRLYDAAKAYAQSAGMVEKYLKRKDSLSKPKQILLQQEQHRAESRMKAMHDEIALAWHGGHFYFRSKPPVPARAEGNSFRTSLESMGRKCLPDIYHKFDATQVAPGELMLLVEQTLTGPPQKFMRDQLGILEKDGDRFVASCSGQTPQRILDHIEQEQGISGSSLLAKFCGPPFACTAEVVKACVAGLLRGEKIMLKTENGDKINVVRDPGVREIFEQDSRFKRSDIFPAKESDVTPQIRAKICRLFKDFLGRTLESDSMVIADAVSQVFPEKAAMLRQTLQQYDSLGTSTDTPRELVNLQKALEDCLRRVRETNPTLMKIAQHLDALREGFQILNRWHEELTTDAVQQVKAAVSLRDHQLQQLIDLDVLPSERQADADTITNHLQGHRPWQEISTLHDALERIRSAYVAERTGLLAVQGAAIESAKGEIRRRHGFSTLTADKAASVLKLIEDAEDKTTPQAIAPTLATLKSMFQMRLQVAITAANERLDRFLSEGDLPMIVPVDLRLNNRELTSVDDIDSLLAEIRQRLVEQLKSGQRVRLI
jgi:hypothetical protein